MNANAKYQYSLLKQEENMLGTSPAPRIQVTRHKHTHALALLFALFLRFLSCLGCGPFRFLHLFIGFVIRGLCLLLKSKHRATLNNINKVKENAKRMQLRNI